MNLVELDGPMEPDTQEVALAEVDKTTVGAQPLPENVPPPEDIPVEVPEVLKCGLTVGLKQDGNIEFKILGEQVSVLDLLGLLEYAKRQVDDLYDRNARRGLPILTRQLAELLTLLKLSLKPE